MVPNNDSNSLGTCANTKEFVIFSFVLVFQFFSTVSPLHPETQTPPKTKALATIPAHSLCICLPWFPSLPTLCSGPPDLRIPPSSSANSCEAWRSKAGGSRDSAARSCMCFQECCHRAIGDEEDHSEGRGARHPPETVWGLNWGEWGGSQSCSLWFLSAGTVFY